MAMRLHLRDGFSSEDGERLALECPYCGVFANMAPQAIPEAAPLLASRPKHVGLVFQCDACRAPVFLRFAVRNYSDDAVELYRNFQELERPAERFAHSYLPRDAEVLFREALSSFSANNFNAFASMCRRAAASAFATLGDGARLRAYEVVMEAQAIAGMDDDGFAPVKAVLFDGDGEPPMLNRVQAGILLEIVKDLFYQLFVRRGKLTRALKVRRFFVEESATEVASSA